MISTLLHLVRLFPFLCGGHRQLALENLALRQQLAVYRRMVTRPKLRPTDRLFWVWLPRVWADWRQSLVIVTPGMRPVEGPVAGRLVQLPEGGGLHHRYIRQAA